MADYYSILKKTIASLPENNGAARRSVYSRARNAIVNQLKAYEPPLSPSEITAEQLRLEEAIRKVEAEAARESLGLSAAARTAPPVSPPVKTPDPAEGAQAPATAPADPAPVAAPSASHAPTSPPEANTEPEQPSPLKDTLSEAQSLGTAANRAAQNAKDVIDPPDSSVDASVRQEPVFDSGVSEGPQAPAADDIFQDGVAPENGSGSASVGLTDGEPPKARRSRRARKDARPSFASQEKKSGTLPVIAAGGLAVLIMAAAAYVLLSDGGDSAPELATSPVTDTSPAGASEGELEGVLAAVEEEPTASQETEDTAKNTDRLLDGDNGNVVAPDARSVTTTTINAQPSVAEPGQPSVVTDIEGVPSAETGPAGTSTAEPGLSEDPHVVPQSSIAAVSPQETSPSSEPGVSAQRSILYEEGGDAGSAGTASQGAAVWSIAEEIGLDGQSQAVLSAAIEIPERDLKVDLRIKPNDDTSLPASHLVEIKYTLPETFSAGDIVQVPGLVLKPTEEARGDALIGAAVKVSPGFFWIALSNLPNEQQRNLALLRDRDWIDIPMVYENGRRGILTIEKGSTGSDAVDGVIAAWQAG